MPWSTSRSPPASATTSPPLASTLALQPVMSLTSRVVAVKGLRPGVGVGYGLRYMAEEPRTIAVVPAGYADGVDARMGGRGHVLIRGVRVPIVGAVSMDMITVDVSGDELRNARVTRRHDRGEPYRADADD